MAKAKIEIQTPVGMLEWAFVTGEGKTDDGGNNKFSCDVCFDSITAIQPIIDKIELFWKDNKPKGARKANSCGVYQEVKLLDDTLPAGFKLGKRGYKAPLDEDEVATGRYIVSARTSTTWPDGKPNNIAIFNSKGVEVSLGDKKIGQGSRGALVVSGGIYESDTNKGISLYLKGVIITKFVEYKQEIAVSAVEDEDGGWDGSDLNDTGVEPVSDNEAEPAQTAKVVL